MLLVVFELLPNIVVLLLLVVVGGLDPGALHACVDTIALLDVSILQKIAINESAGIRVYRASERCLFAVFVDKNQPGGFRERGVAP